jgi:thiol-disulfide isomerase/thioredoxin
MRSISLLMLVLCCLAVTGNGQESQAPLLNIGDPAPALQVRGWLKGTPIQRFEPGRVYVVEFWATWCGPCIAAMPHLSLLAGKHKKTVIVIGVDVMEKNPSMKRLKAFVDSMGSAMDYAVATEDSNFMATRWCNASGETGIPVAFVVNQDARVAWIGHPNDLDEVLEKISNNGLEIEKNSAERKLNKRLEMLDDSMGNELRDYQAEVEKRDSGKSDSLVLSKVTEIVRREPELKYTPDIAAFTFNLLLKTDPEKAYEYGKMLLVTPTYRIPPYYVIFNNIKSCPEELKLPPKIYELGIQAYQARIDFAAKTVDLPKVYHIMADWYWRAHDTSKAVETEEKAIEALKTGKHGSADSLAAFQSRLQQYKNLLRSED